MADFEKITVPAVTSPEKGFKEASFSRGEQIANSLKYAAKVALGATFELAGRIHSKYQNSRIEKAAKLANSDLQNAINAINSSGLGAETEGNLTARVKAVAQSATGPINKIKAEAENSGKEPPKSQFRQALERAKDEIRKTTSEVKVAVQALQSEKVAAIKQSINTAVDKFKQIVAKTTLPDTVKAEFISHVDAQMSDANRLAHKEIFGSDTPAVGRKARFESGAQEIRYQEKCAEVMTKLLGELQDELAERSQQAEAASRLLRERDEILKKLNAAPKAKAA